ncbi:MAG TPA: hypothetical protein VJN96_02070 [Vicinamibacterales bacterium]|nr:hypothetical protein [Vicinamibacterales bacterium]
MAATSAASPTKQLAGFIAKFDPAMQRLIKSCRTAVRERMPSANELVYDNYNFFVIGYSSTERPSDAIVSLASSARGVNLYFIYGKWLPDPDRVLLGGGSQGRYVRLPTPATLSEPAVAALLKAAIADADPPLPRTGRGKLVIRSISAKQRPRK